MAIRSSKCVLRYLLCPSRIPNFKPCIYCGCHTCDWNLRTCLWWFMTEFPHSGWTHNLIVSSRFFVVSCFVGTLLGRFSLVEYCIRGVWKIFYCLESQPIGFFTISPRIIPFFLVLHINPRTRGTRCFRNSGYLQSSCKTPSVQMHPVYMAIDAGKSSA